MPKITVQEQKDLTLLPPDTILHLKVDELSLRDVDGRHGKWEKLEFKFKILGVQAVGGGGSPDDYADVIASPIWGSVPFKLTESPENKLRQWAEAILGMDLGLGFELDTDLLVGRECRGITSQYDKRATNPATGQPFKGHQIESLLRNQSAQQSQWSQPQWSQPQQQQWSQPPQQQQWAQQPPQQQQWAPQQPMQQPAAAQQSAQPQQQPPQQQPQEQPQQNPWGQPQQGWEEPPF